MNTNYVNINVDYQATSYVTLQKDLFYGRYKKMSNEARVLYALLLDRTSLSVKNHFADRDGRIYVFFTRCEAAKLLGVSKRTAYKVFHELAALDLIDDIPQAKINKANQIFLKYPENVSEDKPKTAEKKKKRQTMLKKKKETVRKLNTSIKIKSSVLENLEKLLLEKRAELKNQKRKEELMTISKDDIEYIKQKIGYQWLLQNSSELGTNKEFLDVAVLSLAEMLYASKTKVGDYYYQSFEVVDMLDMLDEYIFIQFLGDFYNRIGDRKIRYEIRNMKAYFKTSVVNYIQHHWIELSEIRLNIETHRRKKLLGLSY